MPFISYVQDPSNLNKWTCRVDPAYTWVEDDLEAVYFNDLDSVLDRTTGLSNLGGPSYGVWNDRYVPIINKIGYLKSRLESVGGRGFVTDKIYNGTGSMAAIDAGKLLGVVVGSGPGAAVTLTLPTRADMMTIGQDVMATTTGSPYLTPSGGSVKTICINGYTSSGGVPLAITVATPSTSLPDLAQLIGVPNRQYYDTIYLYSGEYAELVASVVVDNSGTPTYLLNWTVTTHTSGYGRVGNYVQSPPDVLQSLQLKADNSSKSRTVYPRLWQTISNTPFSTHGLVAQGSKTDATYGDGDGATTFTLPDLTGVTDASLLQYNIWV